MKMRVCLLRSTDAVNWTRQVCTPGYDSYESAPPGSSTLTLAVTGACLQGFHYYATGVKGWATEDGVTEPYSTDDPTGCLVEGSSLPEHAVR